MMNQIAMLMSPKTRKKKGFFTAELTIAIVVGMILMTLLLVAYAEYKANANRVSAQQDLRMFKSAVISYSGLAVDSQPPANLGQLLANPSLSASNAIDGVDHGPFLDVKNGWTTDSSSIKDPWGTAYVYNYSASTGTGTISTSGGGKPMSVPF